MTKHGLSISLGLAFCLLAGFAAATERFEPLLRLVQLSGECSVRAPGSETFKPAIEGRAYPYGTEVRTGPAGTALCLFSSANRCRFAEQSLARVDTDPQAPATKIIRLEYGKTTLTLADDFRPLNGLAVQTASGYISPVAGGEYVITVAPTDQTLRTDVSVNKGTLTLFDGLLYTIPVLDTDGRISLAMSHDRGFLRISSKKSALRLHVRGALNAEGEPVIIKLTNDAVVKFWRNWVEAASRWVVTFISITPEGVVQTSLDYNLPSEDDSGPLLEM